MASVGLPQGAFLTTINGRQCTAVPRSAAAATAATLSVNSATKETTTTTSVRTTSTAAATPATGLAVAPAAEIETAAEQSSTSTTSSSLALTTSTSSTSSSTSSSTFTSSSVPVRIAQAQASELAASARPPTTVPAAVPPPPGATLQSFTAFGDITSSQASEAQSSQADGGVTVPAVDILAPSSDPAAAETLFPDPNAGPAATPLLTTIEGLQTPTGPVVADATGTSAEDPALTAVPTLNNSAVQSTVAVAGGVIGGVVAISVLAFFVWWWRRRMIRRRRSTLLTPLDAVPTFDRDEKGGYVITRGSIGPTPVTEKVRAALGQNFKKIRGHIRNKTAPSVNLDRGTSQFIDMASTHSRGNSGIIGAEPTAKDRLKGWWAGMKFNRRNSTTQDESLGSSQEKTFNPTSQPDYLTLINMDDRQLDREAQRRRASIARLNGSAGSADNFFGNLNLNFNSSDDPFSDANAITRASAKPAPLAVNPFTDAAAIPAPKPATYVADIRRSRSESTSAAREPSTVYGGGYNPRDSAGSLRSLATVATNTNQRTKFRSDPFDLERPELLGTTPIPPTPLLPQQLSRAGPSIGGGGGVGQAAGQPDPKYPARTMTRARAESFSSRLSKYSKYSSGVSVVSAVSSDGPRGRVESMASGDWSDPGPDVGPAARGNATASASASVGTGGVGNGEGRWLPARERLAREREREERERQGGRRVSGGSLGSVGKAM